MNEQITVVGNVASDPQLRHTGSGVPVVSFRLAVSSRRYNRERNEWVEGATNWYQVSAFRNLANNAKMSFQKGDRVLVSGRLKIKDWETSNNRGTNVEIEAEALGHDLLWGSSSFTKANKAADSQDESEAQRADDQQQWAEPGEQDFSASKEMSSTPF